MRDPVAPVALFLALVTGTVVLARALDTRSAPDVVLIILDTTRADRLSCYGWGQPTSPAVDALAAEGVRFDDHHANASWTRPSMASLLTGRYAREVGVYEERFDRLPDDVETLPERLQRAGYTTLGITSNPNINAVFGFDQGFDAWEDSSVVFRFMAAGEDNSAFHPQRSPLMDAQTVTGRALALVDRHRTDAPLYLQVLYVDPHYPYDPPQWALDALGSSSTRYEAEIRQADAGVRALLDGLANRGIGEQALILITSDHGEGLDDHAGLPRSQAHGYTLYDSVTRVPLVMRHPSLPAGAVVSALSSHVDVLPTVLDLLGLDGPLGAGSSLVPRVRGEPGPDAVFMETDWRFCEKASIRTATHRYSDNADHRRYAEGVHEQSQLAHADRRFLERVPATEAYRLADGPERPSRDPDAEAERLASRLATWQDATVRRQPEGRAANDRITLADGTVVPDPWAGKDVALDEGTRETLRALGYLE